MKEHWRDVVGFEGRYKVSDLGHVLSRYTNPLTGNRKTIILKSAPNASGHMFVYLGRGNKRYVHRLVLEAFVGPCPPGQECLHGPDHDPANNRLKNLRWGTRSQNMYDRWEQARRV